MTKVGIMPRCDSTFTSGSWSASWCRWRFRCSLAQEHLMLTRYRQEYNGGRYLRNYHSLSLWTMRNERNRRRINLARFLPGVPDVTTLRSGICYRKSVCRPSVCCL